MPDPDGLHARVERLLREVGETVLLPRLATAAASARHKSAGELVTDADLVSEAALVDGLGALIDGAPCIAEERAAREPDTLRGIERHPWAWVIDPLDGTREFADGRGPFGIMLALLHRGRTEAAWIHLPLTGETAVARRGHGTQIAGRPVRLERPAAGAPLRGGLMTRFFPADRRARIEGLVGLERTDAEHHCAARRYVDLLLGREHLAAYWRTLPWDHLPGVLLVQEAGGVARRFDGSELRVESLEGAGLLVASDEDTWWRVQRVVMG